MQRRRRTMERQLRLWSRALGMAAFSLVFASSHAWAAPFTGAGQGFFTSTPVPNPDGTFSHSTATFTLRGYTTTGGAFVCLGVHTGVEFIAAPTGACGAEELEFANVSNYSCQFESVEGIFHSTELLTSCYPTSCFDENFVVQVGCTVSSTGTATATGGSGSAEGSSGSWTSTGISTPPITQVEPTEFDGIFSVVGAYQAELQGDSELGRWERSAGWCCS